ncbi:MarR family winged helix-turn-helix transcriptional regulator [Nonomuraea endophytica]|uniref:DNA-binding MarR family transcriptional regulator n=1 Tax=Nonomuraea endophytica TaxID=714136 RepID=A0A7W8EMX8_9ACTN|nr:MarR family winged helix-turn-helix transcriptional regulator [Nonomuraea endophytica]MBB5084878.1 DNA-binding MarR family transcriptional regulator [Nonomuraea endophytica]
MSETERAERLVAVFDLVGPLYRRAWRQVEQDAPVEGLTVGLRAVLSMLRQHGPMTVPHLGRTLALSRQFVQRTINDGAALSLVEPVPNPAHRKSSLIRLTDQGAAAVDALVGRERAVLREVGRDLTDADVEACLRVLAHLLHHLDTP